MRTYEVEVFGSSRLRDLRRSWLLREERWREEERERRRLCSCGDRRRPLSRSFSRCRSRSRSAARSRNDRFSGLSLLLLTRGGRVPAEADTGAADEPSTRAGGSTFAGTAPVSFEAASLSRSESFFVFDCSARQWGGVRLRSRSKRLRAFGIWKPRGCLYCCVRRCHSGVGDR